LLTPARIGDAKSQSVDQWKEGCYEESCEQKNKALAVVGDPPTP
jgi:hypothetical protein